MIPGLTGAQVAWVCRIVIGMTFLISGVGKLRDTRGLADGAVAYHILPERLVRPLAPLLPAVELLLAAALLTGLATRWAALASALLFGLFAIAVAVNLRRGRSIPCHCFGISERERIGWATLLRLGVLGAAAGAVVVQLVQTRGPLPPIASPADLPPLISIALAASVLVLLIGPAQVLWADMRKARAAARRGDDAARDRERRRSVPAERAAAHNGTRSVVDFSAGDGALASASAVKVAGDPAELR